MNPPPSVHIHFMEGSSLGNNGSGNPDFGIFCFCGEPTPLRKSGTQKNPGQRFFGCAKYKRTTITVQMKIEAMQKEIDAMQMRNGGK
ncbi:hypothetical protein RHSIM_Rhsim05G0125100 [Rhododendron simsii]|uniref:Uncharacterized protein n=1 Tax=Rhododendron simsii TaxID=118357 RepID=A0A834GZ98_RHOSS|nr:hypothetical protein RHSIM_Rhsim05G0125100 [Rhododendron simsii]